jgi:hypothetical protein
MGLIDTDNADARIILEALKVCAEGWEPEARILGNVRACDIVHAITEILKPKTYIKFQTSNSRCSNCDKIVHCLQPKEPNNDCPSFYICSCGFIGQIGVGVVESVEG